MPVTSVGPSSTAAPRHGDPAAAAAPLAAMPADSVVGHGVTRLVSRSIAYAPNRLLIPGTPPPKRETAGAHGAHKGRISIR